MNHSPKTLQDVEDLVGPMVEAARQHVDANVRPTRIKATAFYKGEPFGDEEHGYSKVVLTELRDAVRSMLPSLMRVFTGPEKYVTFEPTGADDLNLLPQREALARTMTGYINHILMVDNPGFRIMRGWFKDALVRRLGWVMWWVEEIAEREAARHTGLSYQQFLGLVADRSVTIEEPEEHADPNGGPPTLDATLVR